MTHTRLYLPECPIRVQEGEANSCLALLVHQISASKVQPLTQPLLHHHFCMVVPHGDPQRGDESPKPLQNGHNGHSGV